MRISDWSSDVCSSDLAISHHRWISGLAQGAAIHVPVSDRTISYGLAEDGNWFADRPRAPVDTVAMPVSAKLFRAASVAAMVAPMTCALPGLTTTFARITNLDKRRSEEHTSELQSLMRTSY